MVPTQWNMILESLLEVLWEPRLSLLFFFFGFFFLLGLHLTRCDYLSFSSQVDLRFPQSGAPDPNLVTVTGRPEQVDEAIDHLLNLEEEYVSYFDLGGGHQEGSCQVDCELTLLLSVRWPTLWRTRRRWPT